MAVVRNREVTIVRFLEVKKCTRRMLKSNGVSEVVRISEGPLREVPLYTHSFKGGRVMIVFFVNYSTVAFPPHLPTLKRQQFFGAVANSLGKKFIFPATVGRAALCGANR